MVRVDAAFATEVMLGSMGVELVELEMLRAFHDANPAQGNRRHHCTLAATDGTVAAPGINDALWQVKLKFHRAAMTRGTVLG